MSLVSVIIPYFRKKKFIKETVNSAINQTYKNLEIIIIYDDTSMEDLDYIKEIEKLDKRIIVIINQKSLGAGHSRNAGIHNSNGEYIAFLDADDIWKPNKVDEQISFMKKNKFKCSHTSYEIIKETRESTGFRIARTFYNYKELLKSCDIGLSTVIVENRIFTENCKFPNLKTKEDFVLWLQILKNQNIFGGIDKKLTYWRDLDNSLSSSTIQKLSDGFKVYRVYMKFNFIKSLYLLLCLSLNYLKK
jgi:teichuronic acid biosynthesis glycosyltransferase TuaG